jgi:prepilin-type N-terminal cleavage/methylation domain-containing protein
MAQSFPSIIWKLSKLCGDYRIGQGRKTAFLVFGVKSAVQILVGRGRRTGDASGSHKMGPKHMKKTASERKFGRLEGRRQAGFTMVEVVIALAISSVAVGCLAAGYSFAVLVAEKSALSLAANARMMERLEETRSAKWDTASWPQVDELVSANFPDEVMRLDLAGSGSAVTYATNRTQISVLSSDPPLKRIRVDCVWYFKGVQLLTNSIETCRCPDQ